MENRQVNKKKESVQVRLSSIWRDYLMKERSETGLTIKQLIEEALSEMYGPIINNPE